MLVLDENAPQEGAPVLRPHHQDQDKGPRDSELSILALDKWLRSSAGREGMPNRAITLGTTNHDMDGPDCIIVDAWIGREQFAHGEAKGLLDALLDLIKHLGITG